MRYDAAEERWMPMEIRGVRGYYIDLRIDRSIVSEGFHLWELADADNDGQEILSRFSPQSINIGVSLTSILIRSQGIRA